MLSLLQDVVAVIPPHPYYTEAKDKFDIEEAYEADDLWFARLHLLFRCDFRETAGIGKGTVRPLDLALITTFENFPSSDGLAERAGCKVLYDPTPVPCVYVVPVSNILCRAPLMPYFVHGSASNTLPNSWRGPVDPSGGLRKDGPPGRGGTGLTGGKGSKLYQVNVWLWSFGRPIPRLESVADAEKRRSEVWLRRGGAIRDSRQTNAWPRRRGDGQSGQVQL
jgi:hypothetical protein